MNKQDQGWRDRKRAMLRVVLLAAAPMMIASANADSAEPIRNEMLLPPLPLGKPASSGPAAPQTNPFCLPTAVPGLPVAKTKQTSTTAVAKLGEVQGNEFGLPSSKLRLASGSEGTGATNTSLDTDRTTVRLLPLNIEPQSDPMATNKAGVVRSNPMVVVEAIDQDMRPGTLHSVGNALPVDVPALVPVDAPELAQPIVPLTDGKTSVPTLPTVAPEIEPIPPVNTVPKSDTAKVTSPKAAEVKIEGPISFSLDDDQLVETSVKSVEKPMPKGSFASLVKRDEVAVPTLPQAVSLPAKGSFRFAKATSNAKEVDPSASIARGKAASRTLLVPLPPTDNPSNLSQGSGTEARIVKGARPRVDVGVPPVAIERIAQSKSGEAVPVAQLTSALATKPAVSAESVFESATPTILELKRAEVRALKIDGEIRKVQLGNSSICAAVAAGSSQLQLIGAQDGITRMAIWTASTGGEDTKNVYEIRVGASSRSDAPDVAGIASTLTKSANAAFPDSNIRVRSEKGQMIVEGTCSSNDSAKQALRMIRSACLVPVVDKLSIR